MGVYESAISPTFIAFFALALWASIFPVWNLEVEKGDPFADKEG
jgi:hypothetical protein